PGGLPFLAHGQSGRLSQGHSAHHHVARRVRPHHADVPLRYRARLAPAEISTLSLHDALPISGPNVPPTELTCVPALSHSRRTTGSRASVQQATTSAPRTASSKELAARARGWREASLAALPASLDAMRISSKSRTRGTDSR